jgi:hypothetical protein
MVSLAITLVVGAVLNATAFIGGNAISKAFDSKYVDEEKIRHNKAMEAFDERMSEWRKKQEKYQGWLAQRKEDEAKAGENIKGTDYSFEIFARAHPALAKGASDEDEPRFEWKPSTNQKKWEMAYVGGGMLATAAIASRFL